MMAPTERNQLLGQLHLVERILKDALAACPSKCSDSRYQDGLHKGYWGMRESYKELRSLQNQLRKEVLDAARHRSTVAS